jgi:pyruvate dehydrogenase (quinone)
MAPEQAAHLIDRAVRIAQATRSVTCVIVPNDIQESEYSEPPRAHGAVPSSVGFLEPVVRPRESDLQRAAALLNGGDKVAMLVGQGGLGPRPRLCKSPTCLVPASRRPSTGARRSPMTSRL